MTFDEVLIVRDTLSLTIKVFLLNLKINSD